LSLRVGGYSDKASLMLEGGYKNMFDPVIMSPPKKVLNINGILTDRCNKVILIWLQRVRIEWNMRPSRRRNLNIWDGDVRSSKKASWHIVAMKTA